MFMDTGTTNKRIPPDKSLTSETVLYSPEEKIEMSDPSSIARNILLFEMSLITNFACSSRC